MKSLEFTTTHVAQRHDVYKRTIYSFVENLKGVDFSQSTIYVNIDLSPDLPHLTDESPKTIEYLKKIFYKVIPNVTEKPNFAKAIKWCWSQPKNDLFFHLEDDWVLNKNIHINSLLKYFANNKIFAVNLRAYKFKGPKPCLLPSLYRKRFCDSFIEGMKFDRNPERQLREFVAKTSFENVHYPEEIHDIILEDIGRHWLICNGLKRNHISSCFINYVRGQ